MEDFSGKTIFAKYDRFAVSSKRDGYRLTVEGYTGTAGLRY